MMYRVTAVASKLKCVLCPPASVRQWLYNFLFTIAISCVRTAESLRFFPEV